MAASSNYRIIALTVSTAVFMQFLDATALNTALPAMARDLHVPATDLNVAILSYQLTMAALIPVGSALGDRIGPRRAFILALGMFLIGSVLCALSQTLVELTAARAVQGLGGAVMMPISRLLVVRSADRGELVSALNWLLVPGIIGPMLGPGFGGLIVSVASWHWIFLINVPVALLGIVLTIMLVPHFEGRAVRIDARGLLMIAPAIVLTIFALEDLSRPGGLAHAALMLALGIGLGLLYARHAAQTKDPAIDLTLVRVASFRHSMIAGTLLRSAVGALGFVWPLWLQLGMGLPPTVAGLLMMMSPAGALASRFFTSTLMRWVAVRRIAILGAAAFLALLLASSLLHPETPRALLCLQIVLMGFIPSIALSIMGAIPYVDIEPDRAGAAAGFYVMIQQTSLSLGVTLGVWAIAAGRWAGHGALHDNRTYAVATLVIAGVVAIGLVAMTRLDQSVEVLRQKAQPA